MSLVCYLGVLFNCHPLPCGIIIRYVTIEGCDILPNSSVSRASKNGCFVYRHEQEQTTQRIVEHNLVRHVEAARKLYQLILADR